MRAAFVILCASLMLAKSFAQESIIDHIDIIRAGTYKIENEKTVKDKTSVFGGRSIVGKYDIIEITTTVPAEPRLTFGFEYAIVGSPTCSEVPLRMVMHFPQPGITKPNTHE